MPSFSPLTSQGAESYATGHEIIEGNFAVGAVALHDGVHCLRAQIITCTGTHTLLNNNTFIHKPNFYTLHYMLDLSNSGQTTKKRIKLLRCVKGLSC